MRLIFFITTLIILSSTASFGESNNCQILESEIRATRMVMENRWANLNKNSDKGDSLDKEQKHKEALKSYWEEVKNNKFFKKKYIAECTDDKKEESPTTMEQSITLARYFCKNDLAQINQLISREKITSKGATDSLARLSHNCEKLKKPEYMKKNVCQFFVRDYNNISKIKSNSASFNKYVQERLLPLRDHMAERCPHKAPLRKRRSQRSK